MPGILSGFGSTSAKSITIRFIADTAKASSQIEALRKQLATGGVQSVVGGISGTAGLGKGVKGLAVDSNNLTDSFRRLGMALRASQSSLGALITVFQALPGWIKAAVVALMGLGRVFHYGNILEQARMVLEVVTRSEARTNEMIKGMRVFSRETQFLPEQIVGGTSMMAKYGVDPYKLGAYGLGKKHHAMHLMAGLAAMPGMGGQPIGLDRAINAAIAGRDIRPLKALGPEVLKAYETARKAGTSGSRPYVDTMLKELAKIPMILELANRQMNTMKGLWSTITGFGEEMFMDFSGAGEAKGVLTFWSQVRDILMEIKTYGSDMVEAVGPTLRDLGATLGSVFKFIWEVLKLVIDTVAPVFKIIINIIRPIAVLVTETFRILTKLINIFSTMVGLKSLVSVVETIIKVLQEFTAGLQAAFVLLNLSLDSLQYKLNNLFSVKTPIDVDTPKGSKNPIEFMFHSLNPLTLVEAIENAAGGKKGTSQKGASSKGASTPKRADRAGNNNTYNMEINNPVGIPDMFDITGDPSYYMDNLTKQVVK